jgi:hypothetical protein
MNKRLSIPIFAAFVFVGGALLVGPAAGSSQNSSSSKKSKSSPTSKPQAKVKFVWMCSLMERLDLNIISGQTPTSPISNPFQKGGDPSDWRTEDRKAAAATSAGQCITFFSGGTSDTVAITQVFKKTNVYFAGAPNWNPAYKWTKTAIQGLPSASYLRKTGRYKFEPRDQPPGCEVGVVVPRGLFLVQWFQTLGTETDATKVSCDIPAEAMRRTLAALEAGGYEYLN